MSAVLDNKTALRSYEMVLILKESKGERHLEDRNDASSILQKRNAQSIKVEEWGNRKLYHLKNKETRGIFQYIKFESFPQDIVAITQDFKINGNVLHSVITRL